MFNAVPQTPEGLSRDIGEARRRYTRHVNFREGWRGYLWQGRFASFVMDERHCLRAARYIENNPVKAKRCPKPEAYAYSSARAHLSGDVDVLANAAPLLDLVGDWRVFLSEQDDGGENRLREYERTGRPAGDAAFIRTLELTLQRELTPGKYLLEVPHHWRKHTEG
jgi:putative transposase